MARERSVPVRSAQRSLGAIVLGFELIVVFLGALVIFGLKALPAAWALGGGAAMVVAMAVTIALLRYRWAFAVGWLLQLVVVASGIVLPMLYIVGILFTALWAYCMITGAKLDRQARRHPLHPPAVAAAAPGAETERETSESAPHARESAPEPRDEAAASEATPPTETENPS